MAIYYVPRRIRKLGPNLGLEKLQATPQAFSRKKIKDKICWCSVTSWKVRNQTGLLFP